MGVWKYKQITPTVIVYKLRLIKPEDLIDLTNKNLDYAYSMLMGTSYSSELSSTPVSKFNSLSLETALLKNFIKACEKIAECSPKDIGFLIHAFLKKFEANNVKTLIRSKQAGLNAEEALKFITPIGNLDSSECRKILEGSRNVRDVVELLLNSEYGFVLTDTLLEYEKTGNMLLLEVALDKYVYAELWWSAEKLRGLDERIAKTVLKIEIASANIRVLLRSKAMNFSKDETLHHLIIIPGAFTEKEFEDAIETSNIDDCIRRLSALSKRVETRDYRRMLTDISLEYEASHSLSRLELALDKSLLKTNLLMLKRYTPFFNIGLILAFINLKWFEVRNLRAIVKGLENNVPPSEIRKMLLLPD